MKFLSFLLLALVNLNAVMLLSEYSDENLTGWYMSEKLDGVRGVWDGKELKSRNGYKFNYPENFTACFPKISLDGELYTKRGEFDKISSITSKMGVLDDDSWGEVKFYIFDIPEMDASFTQKIEKMRAIAKNCQNIVMIEQILVKDSDEVFEFLDEVVESGGEGVVVREPSLTYENRRSDKILKLKKFLDSECEVVAINEGKGRNKGRMGSLTCKDLKTKEKFKIGSGFSDEMRDNPPKVGEILTYKYQNLTKNNKPRFPSFLRMRNLDF